MATDPAEFLSESAGLPGMPGLAPQPGAQIVPGPGGPPYLLWEPQADLTTYKTHLGIGLEKIAAKRYWIDTRWDYYEGRHREKVLTEKLVQIMNRGLLTLSTLFTNYCSLVVNAPLLRLKVVGWKSDNEGAVSEAKDLWRENDLDLEAAEVHRDALCAGEAFVTVWPRVDPLTGEGVTDADGDVIYDIIRNDARNMHVEYSTRRRRDRAWAVKCWFDGQNWRAVLYYPNEVVRFISEPIKKAGHDGTEGECSLDPNDWSIDFDNPGGNHDFGAVPVVRFARTWGGHSTLDDVLPIQDRINKLTADKIIAGEFAAFPQRYVLTNEDPPAAALKAGAGAVWVIPPTSTTETGEEAKAQVGQFPSADLGNYDRTILQEVNSFFTVAQLPRHLLVNPGVAPTGEAIKADEGPMIAMVSDVRDLFGSAWEDVLELCQIKATPVWRDVEVRNQLTAAQSYQVLVQGGMPPYLAAKLALDLPDDQLALLKDLPGPLMPGSKLNETSDTATQTGDMPPQQATPADAQQT